MPGKIEYVETVEGTSTDAMDTIQVLFLEKSKGHITEYQVEYRDDRNTIELHIWHDVPGGADLSPYYDEVNEALSNLPVSVNLSTEDAPIVDREQSYRDEPRPPAEQNLYMQQSIPYRI